MTQHSTGTRQEWLAARLELLEAEKELTRRSDELARQRQQLPWVRIDKDYRFETDEGSASLADLFRGRSQLLMYHFMFGPEYTAGCPACSAIADGYNGSVVHLANHGVTMMAVSRAPIANIQAYKRRMGWSFPWASSLGSDFNFDVNASFTEEQQREGAVEYNYRSMDVTPVLEAGGEGPVADFAAMVGTDAATYTREAPGMSAFAVEDGVVYHTYSAYARGVDALWAMYQWLDRAPKGRNETGPWFRRHDEYDKSQTRTVSVTQYYTATTLDGFIADPDNSLEQLFTRQREPDGPLNYGQFADAGLLDEVIVKIAPVTLGGGAPLLPRRIELRLDELGRNGDFACAKFSVVRPATN